MQAEALLKLHRHEEADATFTSGPNFDPEVLTKLFTTSTSAYYFLAAAQVDLSAGRLVLTNLPYSAQKAGGVRLCRRKFLTIELVNL